MPSTTDSTTPATVPGVPAGSPPTAPVGEVKPPATIPVLPADKDAAKASVVAFGGNRGGRPRDDGHVPGSPEAKAADREKNRLAKQRARERERQQAANIKLPPPLPSNRTAATDDSAGNCEVVDGPIPGLEWTAKDVAELTPQALQFIERMDVKGQLEGTEIFPARVVERMAADAAWPVEARKALQDSSPAAVAKVLNLLRIPIGLKPVINFCPWIVILIARREKNKADIRKMIAEERERMKADRAEAAK